MITRTDIAAQLDRSARAGFFKAQKAYNPKRAPFCGETESQGAYEVLAQMGNPPMPSLTSGKRGSGGVDGRTGAPIIGQRGVHVPAPIMSASELSLIVENLDWDIVLPISHNAINDGTVTNLERWAMTCAINFEKHLDQLAFQALNTGEATTTLGACVDGQALFSASHTWVGGQYVTAQSNLKTTALSYDNALAAQIAGAGLLDDRGFPLGLNHRLLIYPPDLKDVAINLVDNREKMGTSNREINSLGLQGLEAPGGMLDSTASFLVDPDADKPLYIQMRQRPDLVIEDDNINKVRYYVWNARYNIYPGAWASVVQINS